MEVYCSSCGEGFIIPDRKWGFSHCQDHAEYDPLPD